MSESPFPAAPWVPGGSGVTGKPEKQWIFSSVPISEVEAVSQGLMDGPRSVAAQSARAEVNGGNGNSPSLHG